MLRAREGDRAPPLAAALLMVVWANLHGSFVMGLAIAAAFGLEALVASSDRARALPPMGAVRSRLPRRDLRQRQWRRRRDSSACGSRNLAHASADRRVEAVQSER